MADFAPNTKVLAYHGPLIYEAKVMKAFDHKSGKVSTLEGKETMKKAGIPANFAEKDCYLLHYKGWKSRWDEWVPLERVMEFNDENLQLQKQLKLAQKKPKPVVKTEVKRKGTEKKKDSSKKRKTDPTPEIEIALPLPTALKYLLVDDWEYISKDRKVLDMPSKYPVAKILQEYTKQKSKERLAKADMDILTEFIDGLKVYFNKSVGLVLLYRFERLQYLNLLKQHQEKDKELEPIEVYGVEHLVRLFTCLPGLIAQTSMDSVSLDVLATQITNLLEYINDNISKYANEYTNVSPTYDRMARN